MVIDFGTNGDFGTRLFLASPSWSENGRRGPLKSITIFTCCPICLKRFCCVEHKDEHIKKHHSDVIKKQSQDYLLKLFQKKAERIIKNAHKYNGNNRKNDDQPNNNAVNINSNKSRPGTKRLYSEINQQIVSSSITVSSKTRKILVPSRKAGIKTPTGYETKSHAKVFIRKDSTCDVTCVKTSTPIIKNYLAQGPYRDTLSISQTSSISSYHTPSHVDSNCKPTMSIYKTPSTCHCMPEEVLSVKTQLHWIKRSLTSPRSIMSKISKYDNELGPSPNLNISKSRRVTFSFGSSSSSPLESVKEVEICKSNEDVCVFEPDAKNQNDNENRKHSEKYVEEIMKSTEGWFEEEIKQIPACNQLPEAVDNVSVDLSPSRSKKSGFFNCVTSMIRSAVPIFASWRGSQSDQENRSKRLRSPDMDLVGIKEIQSPDHKRLCYPFDLRLNPIQARKPISQK